MSTVRTVAQRASAQRGVLAVVAALVVLTTGVVGASAALLVASDGDAPRAAFAAATPAERSLAVGMKVAAPSETNIVMEAAPAEDAATAELRRLAAPARLTTSQWLESPLLTTAASGPLQSSSATAYLAAISGDAPVTMLSGSAPTGTVGSDGALPVAVPSAAQRALGWKVGDTVRLHDFTDATVTVLKVTGVYEAHDAMHAWGFDQLGGAGGGTLGMPGTQDSASVPAYGPLLTSTDALAAGHVQVARVQVTGAVDLAGTTPADARAIADRLPDAQVDMVAALQTKTLSVDPLDLRAGTLIDGVLARLAVTRTIVLVAVLVLLLVGGAAALLAARMLAEQRTGETALMMARGSTRGQVLVLAGLEALGLAVLVTAVSPVLAALLVRAVGAAIGSASVPGLGASLGSPLVWVASAACAVLLSSLLLVPYLRRGAEAGRPVQTRPGAATLGSVLAQSAGVVVLVVLAGVATWQLWTRPLAPGGTTDPILVVAPGLMVLAGSLLLVRALPLVARAGDRAASRSRGMVAPLALWETGRRPERAAQSVLLVTFAVAAAVFAVTTLDTWRTSQVDQAELAVGAPVRLEHTVADPLQASADVAAFAGRHHADLQPVTVGHASIAPDQSELTPDPTRVLAVDDGAALHGRLSLVAGLGGVSSWGDVVNALARPEPMTPPAGPLLPDGTTMLTAVAQVDAVPVFDSASAPQFTLEAVVEDARGVQSVRPLLLDRGNHPVSGTGPALLSGTLRDDGGAVTGVRLVGFRVLLGAAVVPNSQNATPQVTAKIAGLAAADAAGKATPVDLGSGWAARGTQYAFEPEGLVTSNYATPTMLQGLADAKVADGTLVISRAVEPPELEHFGASMVAAPSTDGTFPGLQLVKGSKLYAVPPVPAVITQDLAQTYKAVPGSRLQVITDDGEGDVEVIVMAVAQYLPGGSGPGVLVRRDELQRASGPLGLAPLAVDEWWGTAAAGSDVAAASAAPPGTVLTIPGAISDLRDGPDRVGVQAALLLLAGCALLLAVTGAATSVAGGLQLRRLELARLAALGASRASLVRSVLVEHGFLLGLGIVAGAAVGGLTAGLLAARFAVGADGGLPIPQALFEAPWAWLTVLVVALVGLAAVAVGTTAQSLVGRARADLLRLGADR